MATYPPPVENSPVFNSLLFTEAQSGSSSSSSSPTGSITAYIGLTAPAGWLMCDGSEFNEAQFVALYNLLKSNQTPDLRGCFLRASGTNSTYKNAYGSYTTGQDVGSYAEDNIGKHKHNYSANRDNMIFKTGTTSSGIGEYNRLQYIMMNAVQYENNQSCPMNIYTDLQTGVPTLNSNSFPSEETYPPNFAINYIIKT